MTKEEMIVELFKCIGNPTRYKILKMLCESPLCVNKLNEEVGFTQANISQHLRLMKSAGIVKSEKNGLNICYQLANNEIMELIKVAEKIVESRLTN